MVKVLLFSLFGGQTVIRLDEEPLEIATAGDGSFIVATADERLRVYSVEGVCPKIHEVKTIAPIRAVHYLPKTDWVLTLEKDKKRRSIARIYYNWKPGRALVAQAKLDVENSIGTKLTTQAAEEAERAVEKRPSEAGAASPPPTTSTPSIVVEQTNPRVCYEIPIGRPVQIAAVCPNTNRIALATRSGITVWSCTSHAIELTFEIRVGMKTITKLDIFEDYLAYSSENEVRVLQIDVAKRKLKKLSKKGAGPSFIPSTLPASELPASWNPATAGSALHQEPFLPVEGDQYHELVFNASGVCTDKSSVLVVPRLQPRKAAPDFQTGTGVFEVLGPVEDLQQTINVNKRAGYVFKSCTLQLHRQFMPGDQLHSLHFVPEYPTVHEDLGVGGGPIAPLSPSSDDRERSQHLQYTAQQAPPGSWVGVRCAISTASKGYLYDVQQPRCLAEYPYTETTCGSMPSSSFLHTMTGTGLETWTLRSCTSAGEEFPEPCVMGIQPFISLQQICVVGEYVVLLSKLKGEEAPGLYSISRNAGKARATNDTIHWSLYVLRHTSLAQVHQEIQEQADVNKDSHAVFFQLAFEGYQLLHAKLEILQQRLNNTELVRQLAAAARSDDPLAPLNSEVDQSDVLAIQIDSRNFHSLLRRTSGVLGDFYFETKRYARSAIFYAESDRKLSQVIKLFATVARDDPKSGARRAIIFYLDRVLFEADKQGLLDESTALSNEVLRFYHLLARTKLATVILDSYLQQYDQSVALQLLENCAVPNPDNLFPSDRAHMSESDITKIVAPPGYDAEQALRATRSGNLMAVAAVAAGLKKTSLSGADSSSQSPVSTGSITRKNLFVRGLLYLDLGKVEQAERDFLAVEPDLLVEFLLAHSHLLQDDIKAVPIELAESRPGKPLSGSTNALAGVKAYTLGQLLYESDPWVLLETIVRCSGPITAPEVMTLFRCDSLVLNDEYSLLAECALEWVVEHLPCQEAVQTLAERYLARLGGEERKSQRQGAPSPYPSQYEAWIRADNAVGNRDSFDGDMNRESLKSKWTFCHCNALVALSPAWAEEVLGAAGVPYYQRKLQGLLSMGKDFDGQAMLDSVEEKAEGIRFSGAVSLRLLCLPKVGRLEEAVQTIVSIAPRALCLYGAQFFQSNAAHWRTALSIVLDTITGLSAVTSGEKESSKAHGTAAMKVLVLRDVYEEALALLVKTFSPDVFLSILPADGNMAFFLPYIKASFRNHQADLLLKSMIEPKAR